MSCFLKGLFRLLGIFKRETEEKDSSFDETTSLPSVDGESIGTPHSEDISQAAENQERQLVLYRAIDVEAGPSTPDDPEFRTSSSASDKSADSNESEDSVDLSFYRKWLAENQSKCFNSGAMAQKILDYIWLIRRNETKYLKKIIRIGGPFPLVVVAPESSYWVDGTLHYTVEDPEGEPVMPAVEVPHIKWDESALLYRKYFLGKRHWNYCSLHRKYQPFIMSVTFETGSNNDQFQVRILIRTKEKMLHKLAQVDFATGKALSPETIAKVILKGAKFGPFTHISYPGVYDRLLKFDEHIMIKSFEFGVLYQKPGQISETEMFANNDHSEEMDRFLNLLGDRIRFQNFSSRNMRSRDHGVKFVYTEHESSQLLFHVSSLLPYEEDSSEQLLRKSVVCNNRVCLVFQDPDCTPFMPSTVASDRIQVFIVVRPIDELTSPKRYKVAVTAREGISSFAPALPVPAVFEEGQEFRNFLLTKLMKAEITRRKEFLADNGMTKEEQWLEEFYLLCADVSLHTRMFTGIKIPIKKRSSVFKKILNIKKGADRMKDLTFVDPPQNIFEEGSGDQEENSSPPDYEEIVIDSTANSWPEPQPSSSYNNKSI